MPVNPYSTQFVAGNVAGVVSYPVPQGSVVVVRDISIASQSDCSARFYVAGVAMFLRVELPTQIGGAPWSYHWSGRLVLRAGQVLEASPAVGNFDCVISGYLLSA